MSLLRSFCNAVHQYSYLYVTHQCDSSPARFAGIATAIATLLQHDSLVRQKLASQTILSKWFAAIFCPKTIFGRGTKCFVTVHIDDVISNQVHAKDVIIASQYLRVGQATLWRPCN